MINENEIIDVVAKIDILKMENISSKSNNKTILNMDDNASPVFAGFSMVISGLIIALNLLFFLSSVKERKRQLNNTFTFQLLALSVSDVLVGLATRPVYATVFTSDFVYEDCLCRFVVLLSAHAVEQFHIFGICVNRVSDLHQLTTLSRISRKKVFVMVYLLFNWVIFLTIYSVAFRIWGFYRHRLSMCSVNEMFQDNYKTYVMYSLSFYLVPLVLINTIYAVLVLKIKLTTRNQYLLPPKLNPSGTDLEIMNNRHTKHRNYLLPVVQVQSLVKISSDILSTSVITNLNADTPFPGNKHNASILEGDIMPLRDIQVAGTSEHHSVNLQCIPLETQTLRDDLLDSVSQADKTKDPVPIEAQETPDCGTCSRRASAIRPTSISHHRALATMGIVLLCFDVCLCSTFHHFVRHRDHGKLRNFKRLEINDDGNNDDEFSVESVHLHLEMLKLKTEPKRETTRIVVTCDLPSKF